MTGMRRSVLRSACRRSTGARIAGRPRSASGKTGVSATAERSTSPVSPALVVALEHLVADCSRLATGYGMCARRGRDPDVMDVAGSLSTLHRAVADELAAFLAASGASMPRTKSTCSERLRWEWLASTGRLMNGAPEHPLLAECARIERAAEGHVVALRDEASNLDLPELRQLVTLLQRARAASLRLERRAPDSPRVFTFS